jgi:type I restriction enzyme S subunit
MQQVAERSGSLRIENVPTDWAVRSVGEFADVLTGFPFPSAGFSTYGIRLVKGSNVKRNILDWDEQITNCWPRVTADIQKYLLADGDVVIAMDGALVGRSFARVGSEDLPALLLQRVARLRATGVDQRYLAAWICSPFFSTHCDAVKTETAIPHISPADIRAYLIAVPSSLSEQSAIAESLADADAWIDSLEQLIAKKRTIMQGAMQDLLTGSRRLPAFAGASGKKPSEIGAIPDDWDVVSLGSIAKIKTGGRNNQDKTEDGSYPFFVRSPQVERINTYSYDCEAILIPGEGNIGNIFHYISGRFDVHQRVYAITQIDAEHSGKYLYYYLRERFGAHALKNTVKATVDSLRLPTFRDFLLTTPRIKAEEDAIASVLSDMDTELDALAAKLAKARDIKQGLMQDLLTGRVRLV